MQKSVSFLALIPLAIWPAMTQARGGGHMGFGGGFGHGLGLHGGYRRGLRIPDKRHLGHSTTEIGTFAAIEMTASDTAARTELTSKLIESLPAFNGWIIANDISPGPIDGVAPTTFVLVAFGTLQDADHWKTSQPFKDLETALQKVSARVFTINALPAPSNDKQNQRRQQEDQTYRRLIENGDRTLGRIRDICRNC